MSFLVPAKSKVEAHRTFDNRMQEIRHLLTNANLLVPQRDEKLRFGGGVDPTGRPLVHRALTKAAQTVAEIRRQSATPAHAHLWVREAEFRRVLAEAYDKLKHNWQAERQRQRRRPGGAQAAAEDAQRADIRCEAGAQQREPVCDCTVSTRRSRFRHMSTHMLIENSSKLCTGTSLNL